MASPGRLGLFDSQAIIPLATYGPGTADYKLLTQGNSLISTLFVESLDVGASVKVNYYDFGVGSDAGERVNLTSHKLINSGSPVSDRIIVTRIHDKPVAEVIVTGGNATFGVYVTIVSSFASDSDAALVLQGQDVDLTQDRGNPKAIYDPIQGKWFFARGLGGVQDVNITGGSISVTTTDFAVTGVLEGDTGGPIAYGNSATLIDYTAAMNILIPDIVCGGDASGEFTVTINGTRWGLLRNSWDDRQVGLGPGGAIKLLAGDHLVVSVTNSSIDQDIGTYEAFAYYGV